MDGEILMILDGTREGEENGGGFGRQEGPQAKLGGD